ncbi:MAG: arginine repressor [Acidimicrobiales bacterium]
MTKRQRQHTIAGILRASVVANQQELVEHLGAQGVSATQATISRDLEELGAYKVRAPDGRSVYALSNGEGPARRGGDHLRRVLDEWALQVSGSGNLVVVRTPPGCAHVVASALDRSPLAGLLGTVAGDDTVLLVAAQAQGGRALAERVRSLMSAASEPARRRPSGRSAARSQPRRS